jgi:hypothetical protein
MGFLPCPAGDMGDANGWRLNRRDAWRMHSDASDRFTQVLFLPEALTLAVISK